MARVNYSEEYQAAQALAKEMNKREIQQALRDFETYSKAYVAALQDELTERNA